MSFITRTQPSVPITRSSAIGKARQAGMTDDEAEENFQRMLRLEWWGNALYTASVDRNSGLNYFPADSGITVVHISIHRRDRAPCADWRDFQRIKNDIVGPEVEACQLHPAEARVVDTSNEYHIWCLLPAGAVLPFGWMTGLKTSENRVAGSVQRPL